MTASSFESFQPKIGNADELRPGLRRIVAPNPSPMTFRGTNTYLLGAREIAVIDPGPDRPDHLDAILQAIRPDQEITHILVTHTHRDHSPLARSLADKTGAPIYAFGTALDGRSSVMQQIGEIGGGEGMDLAFVPDISLTDGEILQSGEWELRTLHTPGHVGNHLCFAWGDHCFTADHVMGWASSLVSPPDGDLTDFMASCAKLQQTDWQVFYPGHGDLVTDPNARLKWLVDHRKTREASILQALEKGPTDAAALAVQIYTETPPALLGAATRNVLAHLIDLYGKQKVMPHGALTADASFRLV